MANLKTVESAEIYCNSEGDSDSPEVKMPSNFPLSWTSISQCPYANSLRKIFSTSSNVFQRIRCFPSAISAPAFYPTHRKQAAICPSGLSVVDSSPATAAMVSAAEAVQMMR
jgi:hypothetical protein